MLLEHNPKACGIGFGVETWVKGRRAWMRLLVNCQMTKGKMFLEHGEKM